MVRRRHLSSAGLIVVGLASAAQAQSLLTNGDFEGGPAGYGANAWGAFNFAYTSVEYARTGANSFKVYGPWFQYGGSGATQVVAATPGQTYTLAGYALSPTGDYITGNNFASLKLEFLNAANAVVGTSESIFDRTKPIDTWNLLSSSAVAPATATQARAVIVHVQMNQPVGGGAVFFDDLSLTAGAVAINPTWTLNANGDWFTVGNWASGGAPNGVNATANLGSAITAARTIAINGPVTLGTLNINNANRYTLSGTGSLTMNSTTGDAAINVTQGSHTIANQFILGGAVTNANVPAGQKLTISGPVYAYNGAFLNAVGAGTVEVAGPVGSEGGTPTLRSNGGTLSLVGDVGNVNLVASAGKVDVNVAQHVNLVATEGTGRLNIVDKPTTTVVNTVVLTVATGSTLDLTDNAALVNYTDASPLSTIATAASQGAAGGFAGTGLISSNAATNPKLGVAVAEASSIGSPATYLGETIDDTTVIVRTTLRGDANLDGSVNFDDLLKLAANYNGTGGWAQGDFTYDGSVNFDDLLKLASNYNTSLPSGSFAGDWALAQSAVPEPTTALLAFAAAVPLMSRRRR
jgi:hypothetical protein